MVLMVSYSGLFGGAERLLVEFGRGLPGGVCVAAPEGELAAAARAAGFTVFTLAARPLELRGAPTTAGRALAHLLAHGREVRRLTRDLGPDLLVTWGMRSALAALIGPRPASPVVFQHNDLLPGRFLGAAVRAAARRAALTLCLSAAIADELGRGTVVHPGVEVVETPAPRQPPVALLLGAIQPWKRPDIALDAVALARRSLPDLTLRIVGAPVSRSGAALLAALRRRAASADLEGAVKFAGALPDARAALADCTCLLHCAPREPFGMVLLEALAAGRPVVAPDAAGPAEIADHTCGRLYRAGDPVAAAAALVEVLADPELPGALGAAGREHVRSRFGAERARSEWASALASVRAPRVADRAAGEGLALVTVTRNSAAHVARLLATVQRHLPAARVVVVDCASADDSVAVARSCAQAEVIALEENAGFGRASNLAITRVVEPVVALINPDVELVDGSLAQLAALAQQRDRLLAPLVLLGDGRRQDSVHPFPASPGDLMRTVIPHTLLPAALTGPLAPWRSGRARRVGWAVGCAVVARAETLGRFGPFDERLFLYGEDLDLGLRAAAAGVETWFCPSARVVHHRAHTTRREFGGEPYGLLAQSRHDVLARQLGPRRAQLDIAAQALTFASRATAKRVLGRAAKRERDQLVALLAVRRAP